MWLALARDQLILLSSALRASLSILEFNHVLRAHGEDLHALREEFLTDCTLQRQVSTVGFTQDIWHRTGVADTALPPQQLTALWQPAFQCLTAAMIILVVESTVGLGFSGMIELSEQVNSGQ